MAKLDKVKEEIGWLKAIFSIVLVTDLSLGGFMTYREFILLASVICVLGGILWVSFVATTNDSKPKKPDPAQEP
jgi:hypothetical protein